MNNLAMCVQPSCPSLFQMLEGIKSQFEINSHYANMVSHDMRG